MNIYLTCDTHLGHFELAKKVNRPEDCEQKIYTNCQKTLKFDDILIHLGDVSFSDNEADKHKNFLKYTNNCKTYFIIGNHDKRSLKYYTKLGWSCVCHRMDIERYGYNIILTHKPVALYNEKSINIHGHFHNNPYKRCFEVEPKLEKIYTDRHIKLSIEENNYQLFLLTSIIKKFNHDQSLRHK